MAKGVSILENSPKFEILKNEPMKELHEKKEMKIKNGKSIQPQVPCMVINEPKRNEIKK